jgi:hypothetical protein
MIEFSKQHWVGTGVLDFDRARRWFATTWGWSQDVKTQDIISHVIAKRTPEVVLPDDLNPHWAYSVEYNAYRIYVAGDQELEWFILRNPNDA